MTFQMYVLEETMAAEAIGRAEGRAEIQEAFALKLIRRGRPLVEIHEYTELPLERIKQLANSLDR